MPKPLHDRILGYHAFDIRHLDSVLASGLHLEKSRMWHHGINVAGDDVHLASRPKAAYKLGEKGAIAVCSVSRASIMADEDEVPRALYDAALRVGPAYGLETAMDDDVMGMQRLAVASRISRIGYVL